MEDLPRMVSSELLTIYRTSIRMSTANRKTPERPEFPTIWRRVWASAEA